eukprot:gene7106-9695_t
MSESSAKNFKEQLINLNVAVDDRVKTCQALRRRVAYERELLLSIESDSEQRGNEELERLNEQYTVETDKLVRASDELFSQKSSLLSECKDLVENIRQEELKINEEVRALHANGDVVIERAKREFRALHETRLQQFLAARAIEHKESTGKAVQPEINRLTLIHEQELSEINLSMKTEERKLRDEMAMKLQERLEEENRINKEELIRNSNNIYDQTNNEIDSSMRNHSKKMMILQTELNEVLEEHKKSITEKSKKSRQILTSEMRAQQESMQQKISNLKSVHISNIDRLQHDHDELVKNDIISSSLRNTIDEIKRNIIKERDKMLQNEIRSAEIESIQLEKIIKNKYDIEKKSILENCQLEERDLIRRQDLLNDNISDLVVKREELLQKNNEFKLKEDYISSEINDLNNEIKSIINEIYSQRNIYNNKMNSFKTKIREIDLQYASQIRNLKEELERGRSSMLEAELEAEREMKQAEASHKKELGVLDRDVKSIISEKDNEINSLKEEINNQLIKMEQLNHLIEQYSSNHHNESNNIIDNISYKTSSSISGISYGGSKNRSLGGNSLNSKTTRSNNRPPFNLSLDNARMDCCGNAAVAAVSTLESSS